MNTNDNDSHTNLLKPLRRSGIYEDGPRPPKNPLKRLVSAVKRELHEVHTFGSLSLEEIQEINRQKLEAEQQRRVALSMFFKSIKLMRNRQLEHQQSMQRKFGKTGLILAKGGQSRGCCATAMTSAEVRNAGVVTMCNKQDK